MMKWIFLILAFFMAAPAWGQSYNAMTYTAGSFNTKGCGCAGGVCSADLLVLPTQLDGTQTYCKNCNQDALCSPGGTGALAVHMNGSWTCAFGGSGGGGGGCGTNCQTGSFNSIGAINALLGPGSIAITGNSGNGGDKISAMCVNGVNGTTCPVTAFGAKCDGVTDDTAAFNLAYSTMMVKGGGEIDVPGKCVVNSVHFGDVTGSGVIWVKGITANATLLKLPTATTNPGSLIYSDGATSLKGLLIKDITFDCNNVHATTGFQNCVGAFGHTGSFEFDNNIVQNWDGYNGVWNIHQTTSATYLNNTFLNMQVSNTTNQYTANGVMDISSQAKDTLVQGNKCLSGGKCVFVDEWPLFVDAHVNIVGNISHAVTGYAVGNTGYNGTNVNTVYGVIANNTAEGSGVFDSGIIVGGDSTSNPVGQTFVAVNGNTISGISGSNSVGIQFNWNAYATAMGNVLEGASNVGTYAYYCNICEFCNFITGSTSNFLSIMGSVGSGFGANARGTDNLTVGAGYGFGQAADPGQNFLNNMVFQGATTVSAESIPLTGSPTSGTAVCSQSQQGVLKMASCFLNNYVNGGTAQVFYYPVPFNGIPVTLEGSAAGNTCGTFHAASSTNYMNLPSGAGMTAETCNITVMGQ